MSTYQKGKVDAIQLWGEVCGSTGSCANCPIGQADVNISCQAFAAKYPEKMLSLLEAMTQEDYTFYNEYCNRFPEANMSLNEVTVCFCRKALFEGYIDCEVTNSEDACRNCWLEPFSGDVTMAHTEEDNTAIAFCSNCGQSLSPDDRFCTKCGAKI